MEKVKIKFKKLNPVAVIPKKAHDDDACFDFTAVSIETFSIPGTEGNVGIDIGLGIACEIPPGYVMKLYPRSSVYKTGLILTNCVGIIDAGYRGEIRAKFLLGASNARSIYLPGDRCIQGMIEKVIPTEFIETDTLSDSTRGEGGFGSSGK